MARSFLNSACQFFALTINASTLGFAVFVMTDDFQFYDSKLLRSRIMPFLPLPQAHVRCPRQVRVLPHFTQWFPRCSNFVVQVGCEFERESAAETNAASSRQGGAM